MFPGVPSCFSFMKTKLCVWIPSVVGLCTHIYEENNYFKNNFKATPIRQTHASISARFLFVCLSLFFLFRFVKKKNCSTKSFANLLVIC